MNARQRHTIVILIVVLISLTLLAAPARGDDWFGVGFGSHGFSLSFGSTDWAVWGGSWQNPGWSVDYHVALAGYGEWLWVDGLGQCWQPCVTADWRPFTYGRWVWTSLGWTWVSYEPWGYFPHHFGHWAMAPVGWVWMPGTSYHPANVVWVSGGPWVGWYPRPREAADSVEQNAGRAVERVLAPQAAGTLTRHSGGRQATAARATEPQREPVASRREAGSTPAVRSGAPAARTAEAPRAPVTAGSTRSPSPASDRMADARRSGSRSVGAAAAPERSAPARSSSASRPEAQGRRESARQETSSQVEGKGRAEERAPRSDEQREKSAQGSSQRSARR
jgi:hypothetical protein